MSPDQISAEPATLDGLLARAAARWGGRTALTGRAGSLSWAGLLGRAQAVAAGLAARGLAAEDRVAVIVDKKTEAVAAIFGCYLAGGVLVPVNPQARPRQIAHILKDSGARALIVAGDRAALFAELEPSEALHLTLSPEGALAPADARSGGQVAPPAPMPEGYAGRGLANLFYTSGSTGLPKAVACTHANILAGARSVAAYLGNVESDVLLGVLPLSFDAGFSQLTTAARTGAGLVLQDYLLPSDISRACERNGVTAITGVPAIWTAALKAKWSEEAAGRIRYFANTGGHLPYERVQELRRLFPNARPFPMYGLTEAFRSTYLPPEFVDARPGSMGRAIPEATVLVVDEAGEECAPGVPGELVHAGPTVALGYWNNPEETARRYRPAPPCLLRRGITGTVVYSGDLVRRDAEGFLYYQGRRDSLVKISGHRISFAEIEDTAMAHPAVRACAVGAEPGAAGADPVLTLFIETGGGAAAAAEVEALLKRELPGHMVPARIIPAESLPMNDNGKYDVRRMLAELG